MPRSSRKALIGIAADVKLIGRHPFHVVGEKYIDAVAHGSEAIPMLIPALGGGLDLEPLTGHISFAEIAERLDGWFLPGSASNVAPERYGGRLEDEGTLLDPQRDATSLPLILAARAQRLPILAVCRGCQELNVALGGTLHQKVHAVSGLNDHRADAAQPREVEYGPAHPVRLTRGGLLHRLAGTDSIEVNSVHAQGIDRLGRDLVVEATAPDGLIEAIRVEQSDWFAVGVQWHPEWRFRENPLSRALFAAFGDAARTRAAERRTHA